MTMKVQNQALSAVEDILGYTFSDRKLLQVALTHSSYAHEIKNQSIQNNERLEFLGDSVLKLAISEYLFSRFPDADEGTMTKIRAFLVSDVTLAHVASSHDLGRHIRLSRNEKKSGGSHRPSILANVLEALFGAVYLNGGVEQAKRSIYLVMSRQLNETQPSSFASVDYKSSLQEMMQHHNATLPEYHILKEVGPDHEKMFIIEGKVSFNNSVTTAIGKGRSKKMAEQNAARKLLGKLGSQS